MARTRSESETLPRLEEIIRQALRARYRQEVPMVREPVLSGGIRPDFIGHLSDGSLVVVEAVRRMAMPNDVVRLAGEARLARAHGERPTSTGAARPRSRARSPSGRGRLDVEMLLLAPAFSPDARRTAEAIGATLVPIPALSVGVPERPTGLAATRIHLTTRRSWSTVSELLLRRHFPTIRALAQASHGSYAWTHALTSYLESLGVLRREDHALVLSDAQRLLDYLGMERPMRRLRTLEVPIAPGVPIRELMRNLRQLFPEWGETYVCGLSAAAVHGSNLEFPNLLQVYAAVPRELRNALAHSGPIQGWLQSTQRGSLARRAPREPTEQPVRLEIYTADRDVSLGAVSLSGVPAVSVRQALLDCAGLGSAGHRAVQEMVRKHGNAT